MSKTETLEGIVILVAPLHLKKAYVPTLLTSPLKAIVPTPFSNVWLVIVSCPLVPENAYVCNPADDIVVVSDNLDEAVYSIMLSCDGVGGVGYNFVSPR